MCPLKKTVGMMKCISAYYNCAFKVLKDTTVEQKRSYLVVRDKLKDLISKNDKSDPNVKADGKANLDRERDSQSTLTGMKFFNTFVDSEIERHFDNLKNKIHEKFKNEFS